MSCSTRRSPPTEWDRFKTRTRAGLIQQRANPGFLAAEMFNRVVFGSHPAGRVSPTPATLDAITPEALAEFHRDALRARSRGARVRRRHLAGGSAEAGRSQARRMEESRRLRRAPVAEPAPARDAEDLFRRSAGIGADDADRRHAVDEADRSRLRRADGGESRPRRHDGPAVPSPARGEGLHLRHRQRVLGARSTAATGPRPRTCGPR